MYHITNLSCSHNPCSGSAEIPQSTFLFRQFFDPATNSYTYLIGDRQTGDAVLVDAMYI
ncbi:MAG: hypothetical protein RM368_24105 [Nostoc sp. DedSLP03]|nr:hypothetical protein [Nostoc sp. DedSLP03]